MDIQNYKVEDIICNESFQRYCLGSNKEDIQFWENWIKDNPLQFAVISEAKHIFSVLNANQGNLPVQLNQLKDGIIRFEMLKEALGHTTYQHSEQPAQTRQTTHTQDPETGTRYIATGNHQPPTRRILKYAVSMAASLLLVLSAVYYYTRPSQTIDKAKTKATLAGTVIRSGNEPRKTVVLPDGSIVILRSNTTITLASDFNLVNRELVLSGEAFFDVTHHKDHPFTVHAGKINIEVLGTVFNVNAYPANANTETSLFRGKVAVSKNDHPDQKVILTPNMKLILANETTVSEPVKHNPFRIESMAVDSVSHKAREIAWVRNRLKIEDESLLTIADKLQKWYGIEISFADEQVKTYRYSGTFESETVVKALEALQLSYPFNFQIRKDTIVISK
ncbi:FecR family protein [Flavitalea sp.]|nr:FecR domain-containing protein [Flavitalea sp.]